MAAQNRSSGSPLHSLESVAETTDKWWYLPTVSGTSAALLTLVVSFTDTPEWAVEAFVVLVVLPATVLAIPAVAFDILDKYDDDILPPGVLLYPAALLVALFAGTVPLVAIVAIYLVTWVRFRRNGDA